MTLFFNAIIGAISTKLNIKIDHINNTNKIDEDIVKKLTKIKESLRLNLCLSTFVKLLNVTTSMKS